jgi:monovalent cation:H+ antiporter-2, CPA2 family
MLARVALPGTGKVDRADAPRRALVVTFEILILLLTSLPVLALTQPFLPPFRGALLLGLALALLAVAAWRSAQNLEGHMRAGAELLVDAVRSRLPSEHATVEMQIPTLEGMADRFTTATHMLPGIGAPKPFTVEATHHAAGHTLEELQVRGRTGATVLGLAREGVGIAAPEKGERLAVGDTLVLVGTADAVDAAIELLQSG